MKEYWKGWKFYKTETPFDILHFYEDDGDADFDRLFSFSVEGDEARFFAHKNDASDAHIHFTQLKVELRHHDFHRHDIGRLKKAVLYLKSKGTGKDGRRYIDLAAYDDLAIAAQEAERAKKKTVYTFEDEDGNVHEEVDRIEIGNLYEIAKYETLSKIEIGTELKLFSIVDRKHEPNVTYYGLSDGDEAVCLFKKDHEKDYLDRISKGSRLFVAEKKEEYEAGFDLIELTVAVF